MDLQERLLVKRSHLFELCSHHLAVLCTKVEMQGKLNVLNLHVHCENFYATLLNLLFGHQLKNLNASVQNAAGVDLVDDVAKLLLQVSATASRAKVNSALGKDLAMYAGHGFRFMSISKDASKLRSGSYTNPHKLLFDPALHVYDVPHLLKVIQGLGLSEQNAVYELLREELGESGHALVETNLASVINIIAKEDLSEGASSELVAAFNVDDKVAFNGLDGASGVIDDYIIFHPKVDRIYAEFDNAGCNRSRSVLDAFRATYLQLSKQYSGDELFFQITEHVIAQVQKSANYVEVPLDELQLCVNVLAVDAFVRCKIFKKPSGATNAAS
ncbi:ABC-three component system protein [Stenotrophomonas sp. SORGH_AS_0321]|uniref:ABC-three component system protein n=1 Tax=Stenotrophomonas sp. SORGH_AS_0321 TaxID=3041787 RepID=UPI002862D9F7|nr:ABC-three component system protein [Stenotrophomonas sp. SORGH_AS_0321]MDR6094024.1 hypothetical protein [Stenotrophomonas sp. SORGH_AS_0321]